MRARITAHPPNRPWLVAERDDTPVAFAYGGDFRTRAAYRWSTETTIYVAASERGRGLGRALYAALLRVLRLQGYRRAFGGITLPNDASIALHRAVGFEACGLFERAGFKHGAWHDVAMYACVLDAHSDAPSGDPQPLDALDPALLADALRLR
jgi:phosphinothricin acetyltransferase